MPATSLRTAARARAHPNPAQCRQRQHRAPTLRVGLDQQVPPVVVVERKLGQTDHDVPLVLARLVPQPIHRGLDVLAPGGERLAHDLDVPRRVLAVRRVEVADLARDRGGCGWVSHQADTDRLHFGTLPPSTAPKRLHVTHAVELEQVRASASHVSCASQRVPVTCVPVESCLRVRHAHTRWCERGGHAHANPGTSMTLTCGTDQGLSVGLTGCEPATP